MSILSTVANYGGKQPTNTQNIKQFVVAPTVSQADWVFSKITSNGEIYITPANRKKSVYIYTDLYVNGSIYNTSDKNHKEEIEPISESKIEKLFDLLFCYFSIKSNKIKYSPKCRCRYFTILPSQNSIFKRLYY